MPSEIAYKLRNIYLDVSSLTAGDPYARTSDGLRHCDLCFGTGMVKTSSLI
jgi:hypothetical protein